MGSAAEARDTPATPFSVSVLAVWLFGQGLIILASVLLERAAGDFATVFRVVWVAVGMASLLAGLWVSRLDARARPLLATLVILSLAGTLDIVASPERNWLVAAVRLVLPALCLYVLFKHGRRFATARAG